MNKQIDALKEVLEDFKSDGMWNREIFYLMISKGKDVRFDNQTECDDAVASLLTKEDAKEFLIAEDPLFMMSDKLEVLFPQNRTAKQFIEEIGGWILPWIKKDKEKKYQLMNTSQEIAAILKHKIKKEAFGGEWVEPTLEFLEALSIGNLSEEKKIDTLEKILLKAYNKKSKQPISNFNEFNKEKQNKQNK